MYVVHSADLTIIHNIRKSQNIKDLSTSSIILPVNEMDSSPGNVEDPYHNAESEEMPQVASQSTEPQPKEQEKSRPGENVDR